MLRIIFVLTLSIVAQAKVYIWPLQLGMRFERSEEQELGSRTTQGIGVGMTFESWYAEISSQRFRVSSSEGNTSINRDYQDITAWGGYKLHELENIDFRAIAGIGQYKEKMKTTVGTVSTTDTSDTEVLFGMGGEIVWSPDDLWIAASAGTRFLWGESLDPSPQPEVYVKLGVGF